MQLLVFISNEIDRISPILSDFMANGIRSATVVDCKGMLTSLNESSIEPPPIFGSLRMFINPEHESGKMMFVVLDDDKVSVAKKIILDNSGNLKRPNTGIMFTMAVTSVEGITKV